MTGAAATSAAQTSGNGGGAVPRHVGIIMDGNGRWAKSRHLPRIAGHRQGTEAVRKTVRAAGEMGIEVLTIYAFSSENWRRPAAEIADLMGLLRRYVVTELEALAKEGIKIRIIGDISRLEPDLVRLLQDAVDRTAGNNRMTFVIALNYGSHDEIARAVRLLVANGATADQIDAAAIEANLYTAGLPPLDLLIRTSGEKRLSNFLMWQAAYAELCFVDTLWPDFDGDSLAKAIEDYGRRERRYGGL